MIIQPFWRSIFRHYVPGLVNAEMHPQLEIPVDRIAHAA